MRATLLTLLITMFGSAAFAQTPPPASSKNGIVEFGKRVYGLFGKPVHPTIESIAPTGGISGGIGLSPKPWRNEQRITDLDASALVSTKKYWSVSGSLAWQQSNEWRFEPFLRLRELKRLNFYGLGNDSLLSKEATFSYLERRVGATGWRRPFPWLALGGVGEFLWPRTGSGEKPDAPSVEAIFNADERPGFNDATNFIHLQAFANLNYPSGRNERPRRGGDYRITADLFHDTRGKGYSFRRIDVEGQERFKVAGVDRQLTVHALVSTSRVAVGQRVPFYLMDSLGGANNLRGFREDIIGADHTSATLRSFDDFRFRDSNLALFQGEFRQRVWAQFFLHVFADAGAAAPLPSQLKDSRFHHGWGLGLSVIRSNMVAARFDCGFAGGEGKHCFFTVGKGLGF